MTPIPLSKERQERAARTILDEQAIHPDPDGAELLTLTYTDVRKLCEAAYEVGWEHGTAECEEEISQLVAEREDPPKPTRA